MEYRMSANPKYDAKVQSIQRMLNQALLKAHRLVEQDAALPRMLTNPHYFQTIHHQSSVPGGWTHIAEDGYYGSDTERTVRKFQEFLYISANGIVGDTTYNYLVAFTQSAMLGGSSYASAGTAAVSGQTGLLGLINEVADWVINYNQQNYKQAVDKLIDITKSFCEINHAQLVSKNMKELENRYQEIKRLLDDKLANGKKKLAESQHITLKAKQLKQGAAVRGQYNYVSGTQYSQTLLHTQQVNAWNQAQAAIQDAIVAYKPLEKAKAALAPYKNAKLTELPDMGLSFSKVAGKVLGMVPLVLGFGELLILVGRYEDTSAWRASMRKCIFSLMDTAISMAVTTILTGLAAGAIAAAVAGGAVTLPVAATIAIVGAIIGFLVGLVMWFFEDNNIYLSEYSMPGLLVNTLLPK